MCLFGNSDAKERISQSCCMTHSSIYGTTSHSKPPFHSIPFCMSVYIYIYTCICRYACMHAFMHVCMYVVRMYVSVCVCVYVCMYVFVHIRMYVCMYVCIYICTSMGEHVTHCLLPVTCNLLRVFLLLLLLLL